MKTTPNHRPSVGWIAGLFALMAFLPFCSVQAQTTQPRTITLCVTPFGAVYLIHQPGLPDACRSDQHVEIALQVAVSGESQQATAAPPPGVGPAIVQSLNTLSGGLTLTGSGGTTITDDGLGAIDINTFSGSHADLSGVLPDQHHARYADVEAVAAMGTTGNTNALNHDRYADAEAVGAMGAKGNANPLNHERYSDAEAVAAVGTPTVADGSITEVKLAFNPATQTELNAHEGDPSIHHTKGVAPIAFGVIDTPGNVRSGTPNVSAVFNPTEKWYEITIAGQFYNRFDFVTIVTPSGTLIPAPGVTFTAHENTIGGKLLVILFDSALNRVQGVFNFVTFKS